MLRRQEDSSNLHYDPIYFLKEYSEVVDKLPEHEPKLHLVVLIE